MDSRIRRQVVQQIEAFDDTLPSLGHLIADLDAIWSREHWHVGSIRGEFRRSWSKLEEIYAAAVEGNRPLRPVDRERIRDALEEIKVRLPE